MLLGALGSAWTLCAPIVLSPGVGQPLLHERDHLGRRRHERERGGDGVAAHHRLAINDHSELAIGAGLFLDVDAERFSNPGRHPGGGDRGESHPAVANHDSAHGVLPSCAFRRITAASEYSMRSRVSVSAASPHPNHACFTSPPAS